MGTTHMDLAFGMDRICIVLGYMVDGMGCMMESTGPEAEIMGTKLMAMEA